MSRIHIVIMGLLGTACAAVVPIVYDRSLGMKHVLLLSMMIVGGTVTALVHPFFGILPYYVLSILRPQTLWDWALPDGVRWSLYAAVGAVLGVLISLPRVMANVRLNRVLVLMIIFSALVLLSCVNAVHTDVAGRWAQEYLKIFVMAGIASIVIESLVHMRYIMWMVVVTIGYLSWEFNSQYLFEGRLDVFKYGHGGWDNNGAGLLIAIGLPFVYWVAAAHRRWLLKAGAAVLAGLVMHTIMLTYSRGAMVAGILGLVWLALHHRPRWQTTFGAAGIVVCVLMLAGPEIRDEFMSIRSYSSDPSAQSRFGSWAAAWQIAWDHPLTGVGVRNGNLYSQAYGADMFGRTIHNQYLQIAADSGLPAAFVYIAMCLAALWSARRSRKRLRAHADDLDDELDRGGGSITDERRELPERLRSVAVMALAIESALLVFLFGGIFLSLETFEPAWLLIVMAGVLPGVIERQFDIPIVGPLGDPPRTHRTELPALVRRPVIGGPLA